MDSILEAIQSLDINDVSLPVLKVVSDHLLHLNWKLQPHDTGSCKPLVPRNPFSPGSCLEMEDLPGNEILGSALCLSLNDNLDRLQLRDTAMHVKRLLQKAQAVKDQKIKSRKRKLGIKRVRMSVARKKTLHPYAFSPLRISSPPSPLPVHGRPALPCSPVIYLSNHVTRHLVGKDGQVGIQSHLLIGTSPLIKYVSDTLTQPHVRLECRGWTRKWYMDAHCTLLDVKAALHADLKVPECYALHFSVKGEPLTPSFHPKASSEVHVHVTSAWSRIAWQID